MIKKLIQQLTMLRQTWFGQRWERRDRFAPRVIDSALLRALENFDIQSKGRAATKRLPPTRPAEAHFGRRERAQCHGRD